MFTSKNGQKLNECVIERRFHSTLVVFVLRLKQEPKLIVNCFFSGDVPSFKQNFNFNSITKTVEAEVRATFF